MQTFEEFWATVEPAVDRTARRFGRGGRYGGDVDDYRQELIAWLLDNERHVAKALSDETRDPSGYIATCLFNHAKRHYLSLRKQVEGDDDRRNRGTSRKLCKKALTLMFQQGPESSEAMAELHVLFSALDRDDRALLHQYHRDGWLNKMVAQAQGISEATATNRHHGAIDRLLDLMDDGSEDADEDFGFMWRGRKVMSNAAARAYQSKQYDDRGA